MLCVVGSNAACCGSLGGIALFLRLLQSDLDSAAYLQIVLTLAHCTDACGRNTSVSCHLLTNSIKHSVYATKKLSTFSKHQVSVNHPEIMLKIPHFFALSEGKSAKTFESAHSMLHVSFLNVQFSACCIKVSPQPFDNSRPSSHN